MHHVQYLPSYNVDTNFFFIKLLTKYLYVTNLSWLRDIFFQNVEIKFMKNATIPILKKRQRGISILQKQKNLKLKVKTSTSILCLQWSFNVIYKKYEMTFCKIRKNLFSNLFKRMEAEIIIKWFTQDFVVVNIENGKFGEMHMLFYW